MADNDKGLGPTKLILNKYVPKSRKFTDEEQHLRDLWNEQEKDRPVVIGDENAITFPPKSPGIFKADSPIVGSDLANIAERYFKIAPNLRNKATRIQYGPGDPAQGILVGSKFKPDEFEDTNLAGASNMKTGEINLNPHIAKLRGTGQDYSPEEILAHELTHVSGYAGEDVPESAEDMVKKLIKLGLGPSWSSNK